MAWLFVGRRTRLELALAFILCVAGAAASAKETSVAGIGFNNGALDVNSNRARVNYMLNCQGCHLPDGEGIGEIPRMKGFVGNFMRVPGGREFVVRVPGVANAALDDGALAELLNWMLVEISARQLPADFMPYTAAEVGRYRAQPLSDMEATRALLIGKMGGAAN